MFVHPCTHMQTAPNLCLFVVTCLKGGLAEDKERCQVFGALQPGTGDTWRTPKWKNNGVNNIDSDTANGIWSSLSSLLRFSSPNCVRLCEYSSALGELLFYLQLSSSHAPLLLILCASKLKASSYFISNTDIISLLSKKYAKHITIQYLGTH